MRMHSSGNSVRTFLTAATALLALAVASCAAHSSPFPPSEALSGNWQINMSETFPTPQTQLSVSGFLVQQTGVLSGSVQGPTILSANGLHDCGGVGAVSGTISGQSVTFSTSPGGTVFNFSGTLAGPGAITGTYQALPGDCFDRDSSGTFTATQVPSVNGNFTGTLTGSAYMSLLTGANPPAPIAVSGSITQSSNAGTATASLSGTINAVGYPCFSTAALTGTISGQNVILAVYGFDGTQIGTLGSTTLPAQASSSATGTTLTGTGQSGLILGKVTATTTIGPCPPLNGGSGNTIGDSTDVALTFQ
jgi:hypothetical protein